MSSPVPRVPRAATAMMEPADAWVRRPALRLQLSAPRSTSPHERCGRWLRSPEQQTQAAGISYRDHKVLRQEHRFASYVTRLGTSELSSTGYTDRCQPASATGSTTGSTGTYHVCVARSRSQAHVAPATVAQASSFTAARTAPGALCIPADTVTSIPLVPQPPMVVHDSDSGGDADFEGPGTPRTRPLLHLGVQTPTRSGSSTNAFLAQVTLSLRPRWPSAQTCSRTCATSRPRTSSAICRPSRPSATA
jgi:hypothetical protein